MQKSLLRISKILLALIIIGVLFLWYAGFFNVVFISEKSSGPFEAIVVNTGYFDDPIEERNRLFKMLFDNDIIPKQALAVTPDPFGENLITSTGWILTPAQAQRAAIIAEPYQLIKIPKKNRVVADFKYSNAFSIMAGAFVAYPRIQHFISRKGLKEEILYEIYDDEVERIFYHLTLQEQ